MSERQSDKINPDILSRLRAVKTMPELDAMRLEVLVEMKARMGQPDGKAHFERVQREFVKTKDRLRRVPLRDRTW